MGVENPTIKTPEEKNQVEKINGGNKKEKITRREFLKKFGKTSAIVTGTILAPEIAFSSRKNRNEIKKIQKSLREEDASRKTENEQENFDKNKITEIFFKAHEKLSGSERWPKDLFTNDILIAQQLQESKYKDDAESDSGAMGVMQNREISVIDVVRYLNKLKRNTDFDYRGPEKLNDKQLKEIMNLIKEDADCSRVFGKLYLKQLWDDKYGYGVGREKYNKGDIRGAQKEILATYNAGIGDITYKRKGEPRRVKSEWRWPGEARGYYRKIFNYEKRIQNIRNAFEKSGLDANNDYIVMIVAREMDNPKKTRDKYFMLNKYIKIIKTEQAAKNRELNDEEAKLIIAGK